MGRYSSAIIQEEDVEQKQTETVSATGRYASALSYEDEDSPEFSYKKFQQSPELRRAAVRFAKAHLGYDNPSAEKAISETIEHFREFNVNELVSAGDWNYVSGLKADASDTGDYYNPKAAEALEDYRQLYQAFEALPSFGEGSAPDAFIDYAAGILQAPSTYAGILLPGAGKAAGVAAQATSKLLIGQILRGMTKTPLRSAVSAAGIEAGAGIVQDVTAQRTLMEADLQDEYSVGQTALVATLSAALPMAPGLGYLKDKTFNYIDSGTGDLVRISQEAVQKRVDKAKRNVENFKKQSDKIDTFTEVNEKLKALNEEAVTAGREKLGKAARTEGIDKNIRLAVDPKKMEQVTAALSEILIRQGKSDPSLKNGFKTFIDENGVEKTERITEALARVLRGLDRNNMPKEIEEVFDNVLIKYNLTFDDLANIIMADVSDAARLLQQMGQAKKNLKANLGNFSSALNEIVNYDLFGFDREIVDAANKAKKAVDAEDVRGYLKQTHELQEIDAARLAFMTSQTATTVRNVVSGGMRVGFDSLTRAVDLQLRKATGKQVVKAGQEDALAVFFALTKEKEAVAIETVFSMGFEKETHRLFRMLQDIGDGTFSEQHKKFKRLSNFSRQINALNTITDNTFKRAALVGNLKRALNERYSSVLRDPELMEKFSKRYGRMPTENDFNLVEIIKNGRFNDVFGDSSGQKILTNAIDEALYFTYQKEPDSQLARTIISTIHRAPFLLTNFVPFPRFIYNAMKFTEQYSPTFLLYGKGRNELANVLKPIVGKTRDETIESYENAAKGLVGTAVLMAATAYRISDESGDKWYEGRMPDGKTFDLRPFFPLAPYLFVGDLLAKVYKEKFRGEKQVFKGDRNLIQEAVQTFSGTQFRAGLGLYAVENFADDFLKTIGVVEEADDVTISAGERILAEGAANILNTFTIPFTATQDLYNTFYAPDDERIIRDLDDRNMFSLFLSRSLARLPMNYALEKTLEEATGGQYKAPRPRKPATKEGLARRVTPVTRQMAGLLLTEKKNELEKELDRLSISKRSVYGGRTNVPEYDELQAVLMDSLVEEKVIPFINSKEYKDINDQVLQRELLKKRLSYFRSKVSSAIASESGNRIAQKRYGFNPQAMYKFQKLGDLIKRRAMERYLEVYEEPDTKEGYDYRILYKLGLEEQQKINKIATSN
jgi:hypothetical protein